MAEGDLADQLVTYALKARTSLWRIYWDRWGPLVPHPAPDGRLALLQDHPPGTVGRGGLWLASTESGAFWEVILRDKHASNGQLYVSRADLVGRSLTRLRNRVAVPLIDLREPGLRALFNDRDDASWAKIKANWHLILQSPDHTQSHAAAAELASLAADAGLTLEGCTWTSAQDQGAAVHVLYAPPFIQENWIADRQVSLTSTAGIAALRRAAAEAHMKLVLTGGTPFPCEDDP